MEYFIDGFAKILYKRCQYGTISEECIGIEKWKVSQKPLGNLRNIEPVCTSASLFYSIEEFLSSHDQTLSDLKRLLTCYFNCIPCEGQSYVNHIYRFLFHFIVGWLQKFPWNLRHMIPAFIPLPFQLLFKTYQPQLIVWC